LFLEWSHTTFGEDFGHHLGGCSLPHRRRDLGQPIVGLWLDAERLDDRCCGLLGPDERRRMRSACWPAKAAPRSWACWRPSSVSSGLSMLRPSRSHSG
jgi:hypothetical protein